MSARWTPARVAALRAFAVDGLARESNATDPHPPRGRSATVYWQSLRWLVSQGLVDPARAGSGIVDGWFELTPAGVQALADLGPPCEQLSFDPADESC